MDLDGGAASPAALLGDKKQHRHPETARCLLRPGRSCLQQADGWCRGSLKRRGWRDRALPTRSDEQRFRRQRRDCSFDQAATASRSKFRPLIAALGHEGSRSARRPSASTFAATGSTHVRGCLTPQAVTDAMWSHERSRASFGVLPWRRTSDDGALLIEDSRVAPTVDEVPPLRGQRVGM